jgi:hypothetical protein
MSHEKGVLRTWSIVVELRQMAQEPVVPAEMATELGAVRGAMMSETIRGRRAGEDRVRLEILGLLGEPVPGQLRVPSRQHQSWRPPTDVYETDDFVVVKVEIAGVDEQGFSISLDANRWRSPTGVLRRRCISLGL